MVHPAAVSAQRRARRRARLWSLASGLTLVLQAALAQAEPLASGDRATEKGGADARNFDWTRPAPEDIAANPASGAAPRPALRDVTAHRSEARISEVQWDASDPGVSDTPDTPEKPAASNWSRPQPGEIAPNPAAGAGTRPYVRSVGPATAARQGDVRNYTDAAYQGSGDKKQTAVAGGGAGDGVAARPGPLASRAGQKALPRDGVAAAPPGTAITPPRGSKADAAGGGASTRASPGGDSQRGDPQRGAPAAAASDSAARGATPARQPAGSGDAHEAAREAGRVPAGSETNAAPAQLPSPGSSSPSSSTSPAASSSSSSSTPSSSAPMQKASAAGGREPSPGDSSGQKSATAAASNQPTGAAQGPARSGAATPSDNVAPSREGAAANVKPAGRPGASTNSASVSSAPGEADLARAGRGLRGVLAPGADAGGSAAARGEGRRPAAAASTPATASDAAPAAPVPGTATAPGRVALADSAPAAVRGGSLAEIAGSETRDGAAATGKAGPATRDAGQNPSATGARQPNGSGPADRAAGGPGTPAATDDAARAGGAGAARPAAVAGKPSSSSSSSSPSSASAAGQKDVVPGAAPPPNSLATATGAPGIAGAASPAKASPSATGSPAASSSAPASSPAASAAASSAGPRSSSGSQAASASPGSAASSTATSSAASSPGAASSSASAATAPSASAASASASSGSPSPPAASSAPPRRVNLFAKLDFPTLAQTLALPPPPPTPPSSPVGPEQPRGAQVPPPAAAPAPPAPVAAAPRDPAASRPAPPAPAIDRAAVAAKPAASPAPPAKDSAPRPAAVAAVAPPVGAAPADTKPPSPPPARPLMATLRDAAARVDWAQAHADGLAILRKQMTIEQLSADNRDNLLRARDIMSRLAANEDYYRAQTLRRLDTYDDLKKDYAKYIHQRDVAALQGAGGGVGLAVIYTVDMAGHLLAATGIPLAKFYNTVRDVSDQTVTVVQGLASAGAAPAKPVEASRTPRADAAPGAPASEPAQGRATARGEAADKPGEPIRRVTEPIKLASEIHKAIEETVRQDNEIEGVDRVKGWTRPRPAGAKAEDSPALKVSKSVGELTGVSLKLATSVADVQDARRSGDADRIYKAETDALRASLQGGAKLIELGQRGEKLAGIHGPSGEFTVPAQVMRGFQAADKVVGAAQTGVDAVDAYYEARDGHYEKAWSHARDGATNAAKTFTSYGGQVEAAGKAVDAFKRATQATTTRDKVTGYLEYAGYGAKVATIPGAADAGDAILKAKEVVAQGFVISDAVDLHRQDTFKPSLDRLGRNIRDDYELYMYLNQFRPMFDLPGHAQPVNLLPLDPSIPRPNPL